MSLNKIVDGRLHDFHVYYDCELMKNIKVIQHIATRNRTHHRQVITDEITRVYL
jgi:hypothetical protein